MSDNKRTYPIIDGCKKADCSEANRLQFNKNVVNLQILCSIAHQCSDKQISTKTKRSAYVPILLLNPTAGVWFFLQAVWRVVSKEEDLESLWLSVAATKAGEGGGQLPCHGWAVATIPYHTITYHTIT